MLAWTLTTQALNARLAASRLRREHLAETGETHAYRCVHGLGDGLPGITLDRYETVGVLSLYGDCPGQDEHRIALEAATCFSLTSVYVKRRPKSTQRTQETLEEFAPSAPVVGLPQPSFQATERGLRFWIRPGEGLGVGLYLDARAFREHVEAHARGARVLNLFAYTGGFSLAARRGGAREVTDVDLSKRVLTWAAENAALNGLRAGSERFIAEDAFRFLERASRKGAQYDVIVSDPPAFSSSRGRVFTAREGTALLTQASAQVLTPGGRLVACCNQVSLAGSAFEVLVHQGVAAAGRRVQHQTRLFPSQDDFPLAAGEEPSTKALALVLD
ncbi:MAG: class I SAM-dependent rRNA methyltransferase [Myxococcaceae bacterium]